MNSVKEIVERMMIESANRKFLKLDIINLLIEKFKVDVERIEYVSSIKNPIKIALEFYKEYNSDYYKIIEEGMLNGRIIIVDEGKSFVDTMDGIAKIKLCGNDCDVFILVHEMAHYIDRNSNPKIIPDEYWFLSETFSFYIEKQFEKWLNEYDYNDLVLTRKNNRIYYEREMLKAIEVELYYEELYRKKGVIEETDIDLEKIKLLKKYNYDNLINYLLQYPIANVISDYLIDENIYIKDDDFVKICLSLNLYLIIKDNKNLAGIV